MNAIEINKYGIVIATFVIKTNLSKNLAADSPPNETSKIKTIAINACTFIALIGRPFLVSVNFFGQIFSGVPSINCFNGLYDNVINAPLNAKNIDNPTKRATQAPI